MRDLFRLKKLASWIFNSTNACYQHVSMNSKYFFGYIQFVRVVAVQFQLVFPSPRRELEEYHKK